MTWSSAGQLEITCHVASLATVFPDTDTALYLHQATARRMVKGFEQNYWDEELGKISMILKQSFVGYIFRSFQLGPHTSRT